jgi:ubiquinone/menaquinone biosynthesis C-methylase UbiE
MGYAAESSMFLLKRCKGILPFMTFQKDAEKHETKALHKLVDLKDQRVLEVGCGEGRLTWEYARLAQQVVGIDPDSDSVRVADYDMSDDLRKTTTFVCASSLNLPFPPESFDIALLSWSL